MADNLDPKWSPCRDTFFKAAAATLVPAIVAQAAIAQPAAATAEPLVATPGDSAGMRIHVGATGIFCAKFPCPSRGVFLRAEQGDRQPKLLYTDRDGRTPPPPMIGREADLAAIRTAWQDRECLAIDGRLVSDEDDKPVLRVDRIVGPCAGAPR